METNFVGVHVVGEVREDRRLVCKSGLGSCMIKKIELGKLYIF